MGPLLDYASPTRASPPPTYLKVLFRRSREILVVQDPWMAVIVGIHLEFAIASLHFPVQYHYPPVIGTEQGSLFAWCWRVLEFGCNFTWYSAIAPFFLLAVCLGPAKRVWLYGFYIISWSIFLAVNWMATAYLKSQLPGVWAACMPASITYDWPALLLFSPAYFFLLIRLLTPGVRFAGPLPRVQSWCGKGS